MIRGGARSSEKIMHQQNAGADADSKKRHSTRSKLVDSRRNAQFVQTLNFFIGRENIVHLVRRHTFTHDRIHTGCEPLNRLRHPVPMARHDGSPTLPPARPQHWRTGERTFVGGQKERGHRAPIQGHESCHRHCLNLPPADFRETATSETLAQRLLRLALIACKAGPPARTSILVQHRRLSQSVG